MPLDVELAEIRDFLAHHSPWDELPHEVLASIPERLSITYHRRGSVVLAAGDVPSELLVVRSGAVELRDADGDLVERGGAGTCIGGAALASHGPQPVTISAIEDTLTLACPGDLFSSLREEYADFTAFFEERAGRLRAAVARQRRQHATDAEQALLRTRAADLADRAPVSVPAGETIVAATRLMSAERISSVLVTDGERLVGIVTDRDLRSRVLAAGTDPADPVSTVMTPDPHTCTPDALALEVMLELARRNIHHLPVVEDRRPVGMITATDLLRLEQANPVHLVGEAARAADVEAVASVARRLHRVVASLARQGTSAHDTGRVVTTVGDAIERRLLTLAEAELGPPPVPYAWVTLGSRARFEQALGPDQDHALVLHDDHRPDHAAYFSGLAAHVVSGLEAAGYARCRGDKMASNPRWRVPLATWREYVDRWVAAPTPEAVMESSVFFDLRHLAGDAALTASLGRHQREAAARSPRFLAHLAAHAASAQPPLGFFRNLVVDRSGAHRDTLDLKRGGLGPIVEIARLHGLAAASEATATLARLDDAVAAGGVSEPLGADLRDAWEFLAGVRLRHQADLVRAGQPPDNRIAPDALSSFEKRSLKLSFAVIRSAQSALAQRYPVQALT